MSELNKHEIRSPEMQEVMSEIPGSFLRWGLFVFFGIIAILITGSYFIRNQEIVTVPVRIATKNPVIPLVSKSGGNIEKLFVNEGIRISGGEVVAYISNTSKYDDIENLGTFLSSFNDRTSWIEVVRNQPLPPDLELGEIQVNYSAFRKMWKQMKDYIDQAYIPEKFELLEKQIENKQKYNLELKNQEKYQIEDLTLARKSFERDSLLFHRAGYSISRIEYERSRQAYIQKQYSFSVFKASLNNNEADFLRLNEILLDLQVQYKRDLTQFALNIEESLQLMRSALSGWEERYLIKSPVAGIVAFPVSRSENQLINAGETFATIIPENTYNIIAKAIIPVSEFGKIEKGQPVNIKLSGFPYMQYGVLKGRISSISQVPGEDGFTADIELTEGMTSTYGDKIRFIHEMGGTVDIITGESRLIYRFIKPLKGIFH